MFCRSEFRERAQDAGGRVPAEVGVDPGIGLFAVLGRTGQHGEPAAAERTGRGGGTVDAVKLALLHHKIEPIAMSFIIIISIYSHNKDTKHRTPQNIT